jgi:hypothetical protein
MELTKSGNALVVTLLFRLLFGGYLIGMDQYRFDDVESALTVLLIYGLIGIFLTLFLLGKRCGLLGIICLDVIFIALQSAFTIAAIGKTVDADLHDPLTNWWATLLMFLFSILTLTFAFKIYRETRLSLHVVESPSP